LKSVSEKISKIGLSFCYEKKIEELFFKYGAEIRFNYIHVASLGIAQSLLHAPVPSVLRLR